MRNGHREMKIATVVYALLVAFAGTLFAGGTGTLDRVSGWYPVGTNLTVTATPSLYSAFDSWTGDTNGAAIAGLFATALLVLFLILFAIAEAPRFGERMRSSLGDDSQRVPPGQ